jgi:hypothetical protein
MTYTARLRRGLRPKTGDGYPTLTEDGTLTLPPPDAGTYTAGQWMEVTVKSEAPPDRTGLGKGAVGVSVSGQSRGRMPERSERMTQ